eukprot:gnl/Dysnectes_brevis/6007_a9009_366.p1 GENE.gnl/Dysnectes_brevis/6007_a9009_366~~gnl/Dysnectes_brevis/6007_a9009_366.p1  ORF type:complete len:773 (-),score=67.43 gnl/Dysnectes_brevis/6007_a9009_366:72-2339(-)
MSDSSKNKNQQPLFLPSDPNKSSWFLFFIRADSFDTFQTHLNKITPPSVSSWNDFKSFVDILPNEDILITIKNNSKSQPPLSNPEITSHSMVCDVCQQHDHRHLAQCRHCSKYVHYTCGDARRHPFCDTCLHRVPKAARSPQTSRSPGFSTSASSLSSSDTLSPAPVLARKLYSLVRHKACFYVLAQSIIIRAVLNKQPTAAQVPVSRLKLPPHITRRQATLLSLDSEMQPRAPLGSPPPLRRLGLSKGRATLSPSKDSASPAAGRIGIGIEMPTQSPAARVASSSSSSRVVGAGNGTAIKGFDSSDFASDLSLGLVASSPGMDLKEDTTGVDSPYPPRRKRPIPRDRPRSKSPLGPIGPGGAMGSSRTAHLPSPPGRLGTNMSMNSGVRSLTALSPRTRTLRIKHLNESTTRSIHSAVSPRRPLTAASSSPSVSIGDMLEIGRATTALNADGGFDDGFAPPPPVVSAASIRQLAFNALRSCPLVDGWATAARAGRSANLSALEIIPYLQNDPFHRFEIEEDYHHGVDISTLLSKTKCMSATQSALVSAKIRVRLRFGHSQPSRRRCWSVLPQTPRPGILALQILPSTLSRSLIRGVDPASCLGSGGNSFMLLDTSALTHEEECGEFTTRIYVSSDAPMIVRRAGPGVFVASPPGCVIPPTWWIPPDTVVDEHQTLIDNRDLESPIHSINTTTTDMLLTPKRKETSDVEQHLSIGPLSPGTFLDTAAGSAEEWFVRTSVSDVMSPSRAPFSVIDF